MLNLPLPWKRGADDGDEEPPPPGGPRPVRRRGGRNRRVGVRSGDTVAIARTRRILESRRQRIAIVVGAVLLLAIAGVVAAGIYQEYIRPPRVMAGDIRGVRFTMGDLVERIRVLQGINRYQGGQVDLSRDPFDQLTKLLHAEILRQAAPGLQINVTDDDIEQTIRSIFRPQAETGQEVNDEQLDAEYGNNYVGFLDQVNLSDEAYRRIVEEQLQENRLFQVMLVSLPEEAPHVEAQAIVLGANSPADPVAVRERLQLGEDFASVSREISGSDGYIGWVPEGAITEFNRHLFGEDGEPPLLGPGDVSSSIFMQDNIVLLQAIGEPETREIEPAMQFQLAAAGVERWKDDQLSQGADDGWVKMNFRSSLYEWVTQQVRLTRPRVTPVPQQ